MRITLKQLKLFEAIARHGSITNAAKEASISQPAVSLQMKQFEEEIGEPLWERSNKRFELTATGDVVLAAAHDVLLRVQQLQGDLEAARGQVFGKLDIAVVTSAKYFLPNYLGEFMRLYPKVEPRLTVTNRASVLEAIAEKRHDIYIMGQVPVGLLIEAHNFLDNILEVVAAADHPLGKCKNISLEQLAAQKILVREPGSGTRIAVDRLLVGKGLEIKPFMELGSSGAIKNAVIAGLGIAVLSRHSLKYELKSGAIQTLKVEGFPLRRQWYVACPNGKQPSVAARTFLEFLTSDTAGRPGGSAGKTGDGGSAGKTGDGGSAGKAGDGPGAGKAGSDGSADKADAALTR